MTSRNQPCYMLTYKSSSKPCANSTSGHKQSHSSRTSLNHPTAAPPATHYPTTHTFHETSPYPVNHTTPKPHHNLRLAPSHLCYDRRQPNREQFQISFHLMHYGPAIGVWLKLLCSQRCHAFRPVHQNQARGIRGAPRLKVEGLETILNTSAHTVRYAVGVHCACATAASARGEGETGRCGLGMGIGWAGRGVCSLNV